MKREIEFRGKRVDNREWVYGSYFKATLHWHEKGIHEDWIATRALQNGGWCTVVGKHAVIPETVGQYTGLTDKNGKKIFEGDKVKFTDTTFGYSYIGDVCFDKGSFCILYEFYGQKKLHRIGKTEKWQDMGASGTITYTYEVIGNIFDKESDNGD